MGYTTDFEGRFEFDRKLTVSEFDTLRAFNDTRHGGNIKADPGKPGFWCQWTPSDDMHGLEWDGGEKFYSYTEWLQYIVDHFCEPWGLTLNGSVKWSGESSGDSGVLTVKNNKIKALDFDELLKSHEAMQAWGAFEGDEEE